MKAESKPDRTTERKNRIAVAVLALVALAMDLLFNAYIFHPSQGVLLSLSYLASSFFILFSILLVSCRVRTIGFILMPYVLLCAIAPWYIYERFGIFITQDVISSIIETNWEEAAPYVTVSSVSLTVCGILLMGGLIVAGHQYITTKTSNISIAASVFLFVVCFALTRPLSQEYVRHEGDSPNVLDYLSGRLWPVADCYRIADMVKLHVDFSASLYADIQQLPSGYVASEDNRTEADDDDVVVVLMMGESLRADHLGINGYERDTTPMLNQWKDQLVSFKKTCSFGLFTRVSIIGILTDAEVAARTVRHKPFPDMLQKGGFHTYLLLPDVQDIRESLTRKLTEDIESKYPIPTTCPADAPHHFVPTVERFKSALADAVQKKKSFILVYDNGAHIFFQSMDKNKRFMPDKPTSDVWQENLVEWTNAYDNNIVEIDMEMNELFDLLERTGKPAVFLYASDHGVALGEEGFFGHGNASKPVHSPAMFVWCSRAYLEKHPDTLESMRKNADKEVSHDHVMHTVLSFSGIRFGAYQKELDLTNPDAKETPVPANIKLLYKVNSGKQEDYTIQPHD